MESARIGGLCPEAALADTVPSSCRLVWMVSGHPFSAYSCI